MDWTVYIVGLGLAFVVMVLREMRLEPSKPEPRIMWIVWRTPIGNGASVFNGLFSSEAAANAWINKHGYGNYGCYGVEPMEVKD